MDMVVRVSAGEGGQSGLMRRSAQSSSAPFYFRPPETHNVLEREHFQYFFSKGDMWMETESRRRWRGCSGPRQRALIFSNLVTARPLAL